MISKFQFLYNPLLWICFILFNKSYGQQDSLTKISSEEMKEPAIILLDSRIIEYRFPQPGDDYEKGKLENNHRSLVVHRRIHINSDKGLEMYNKLSIYLDNSSVLKSLEAKFISPDYKTVFLDASKIKDVNKGNGKYKILAIEGAQVGGELDYTYTIYSPPYMECDQFFVPDVSIRRAVVEFHSPLNGFMQVKGYYNPWAEFSSANGNYQITRFESNEIKCHHETKYEAFSASIPMVISILDPNRGSGFMEDSNRSKWYYQMRWRLLGNNYYELIHNVKGTSNVYDLCSDLGILRIQDPEAKIIEIEKYIKSNIEFKNASEVNQSADENEYALLKNVIKNKFANQMGLVRLYAAFFDAAKIPYKLLITASRYDEAFDVDFPKSLQFRDFVFYFPQKDKYVVPTSSYLRYGMCSDRFEGNFGLVILKTDSLHRFHKFPVSDTVQNSSYKNFDVELQSDLDELLINAKISYRGYNAFSMRGTLYRNKEEQIRELKKRLSSTLDNETSIKSEKFENTEISLNVENKPLIFEYQKTTKSILEKANDKILLNLGLVIGKQFDLYNAPERTTPIIMGNPSVSHYTIRFKIPQGYRLKNPNELDIQKTMRDSSNVVAGFSSTSNQVGDVLEVKVTEFYMKNNFSISLYDQFKDVINASFDFTKKVLILEKN